MGSIVSRGRRAATSGGSADPAAGRAVAPRGSRRATWALGAVCALLAAGLFSWMSVGQWERWDSPSWDLAIFSQLAQDYAHLRAPIVDIKGHGFNLLGDHFHPLLILLGPVWALWPSGLAIMITQDALLGLGAGILAGFGTRFLGWARGLCLGTAFTLSFGVLEAGLESVKDPRWVVEPQKARLAARRAAGTFDDSITTGPPAPPIAP